MPEIGSAQDRNPTPALARRTSFAYPESRVAKADLHLHSRHSNRSAEWVFRRLGMPDSYAEPRAAYDALRRKGMDFFTLTDHNTLDGCLSLAGLPGVFLSEQVTARFPEDRCEVHILVWGLDEAQHRDIAEIRENIYDLQRYLDAQELAHAVAHPLFPADENLGPAHFEKLILLFRHFEVINGLRDALLGEAARFILDALTPAIVERLADRHGLPPTHAEPWNKVYVGGSDDHSSLFPGCAYTETPSCVSAEQFLAHLRAGRCEPRGTGGSPLRLSHGLYRSLHRYATEKLPKGKAASLALVEKSFERFMEGRDPTAFTWMEKLGFLGQGILTGRIFELAAPSQTSLLSQLASYFARQESHRLLAEQTAGIEEPERRSFIAANLFVNQLAYKFFTDFLADLSAGRFIESIQRASAFIPLLLPLAPYVYAFQSQTPSHRKLRDLSLRIAGALPPPLRNEKRAWFTDTLEDVNGVANTIRKLAGAALKAGRNLVVVTSRAEVSIGDIPVVNFKPVGEFELPEYELQKLSFPPILQIVDYIQRERFTELIISTPGPVGLSALLAAKVLGLRTSGIYHTDFPQYIRILTDDSFLETLTWNYMHWFYSHVDTLYVNSAHYRDRWVERGIPASRIAILPRGLDTALFHPDRRDDSLRTRWGLGPDDVALLYVGRISKEKNLEVFVAAAPLLARTAPRVKMIFVGDGPYLAELREALPGAVFTGYLAGQELARAFASGDIFGFPSTTDTFGNVILEAMASGLPCIVSDIGGPRELVREGQTGTITRALNAGDFAEAVAALANDPALRARMAKAARSEVANRDWSEAFERFWALSGE